MVQPTSVAKVSSRQFDRKPGFSGPCEALPEQRDKNLFHDDEGAARFSRWATS